MTMQIRIKTADKNNQFYADIKTALHQRCYKGEPGGQRAEFINQDLRHVTFRGKPLCGANFYACDLRDADLSGCDLNEAVFADCKNVAINLDNTVLVNTKFIGCDCRFASMRDAVISHLDSEQSDFSFSDLAGAELIALRRNRVVNDMRKAA